MKNRDSSKNEMEQKFKQWKKEVCEKPMENTHPASIPFTTVSGKEIKELYTPLDLEDFDYTQELGFPGEYPFTRGIHPTMYRGRLWTMRQFSGFGTAEQTNQRYKYLLNHGTTGLSVAFHLPTLMGWIPIIP